MSVRDGEQVLPPAPNPCPACPYRRDAPVGLWDQSEYDKLPTYDGPTGTQPGTMFICHLHDGRRHRVCAGWAGCHDMAESLGLRLACSMGIITEETFRAVVAYTTGVPLWPSGAAAAAHGLAAGGRATLEAAEVAAKLRRVRPDLIEDDDAGDGALVDADE